MNIHYYCLNLNCRIAIYAATDVYIVTRRLETHDFEKQPDCPCCNESLFSLIDLEVRLLVAETLHRRNAA